MIYKSTLAAISICTFAVLSHIDSAHAVTYSIVDLGTLGGGSSVGRSVNDNGVVTGSSDIAGNTASLPSLPMAAV